MVHNEQRQATQEGAANNRRMRLAAITLLASLSLSGCAEHTPVEATPAPTPVQSTCAPLAEAGPSTDSECVTPGMRTNLDGYLIVRHNKGQFEAYVDVTDVRPGYSKLMVFEEAAPGEYKWNQTLPNDITSDVRQIAVPGFYTKRPGNANEPAYTRIVLGMASREAADQIVEDISADNTLHLLTTADLASYGVDISRSFGDGSLQGK